MSRVTEKRYMREMSMEDSKYAQWEPVGQQHYMRITILDLLASRLYR